ncbi:MAG: HAMP domain-containing sensor histidine kinase [bacterium]
MFRLTTRTKIALQFSGYALVIILFLELLFSVFSYFLFSNEIDKILTIEANEINTNYLTYEEQRIIYTQPSNIRSLDLHLRDDQMSALIFNKNLERIGVFGFYRDQLSEKDDDNIINEFQYDQKNKLVLETGKPYFFNTKLLQDHSYRILCYPVKFNGETVGVVQLARDIDIINQLFSLNLTLLIVVLPLGIFTSWIIGIAITNSAFKPIRKLWSAMQRIDASKMKQRLEFKGSEKDELVQLTQSYNAMLDRLEQGIDKQKRFIANASHEFRNPLADAVLTLDLMTEDLKAERAVSVSELVTLKENLLHLNAALENLLILAKLEDAQQVTYEKINLANLAIRVLEPFEKQIQEKKLAVINEIDKNMAVSFSTVYLQIIIKNLLENAIKYNHDQGQIIISAKHQAGLVSIQVSDTGIGMTPQELNLVTERFFRSPRIQSTSSGFGLGLAIIKEIADVYHLQIEIKSHLNQGTSISITGLIAGN